MRQIDGMKGNEKFVFSEALNYQDLTSLVMDE